MPRRPAQARRTVFACPECGTTIRPPEHPDSRRTRCEECLTLVEVPYLVRVRAPRRRGAGWAWVAIVAATAAIVVLGTFLVVRARIRSDRQRALEALIAAAREDERSGAWARARDRLDAALALAGSAGLDAVAAREELHERRDHAAERAERDRREALVGSARADLAAAAGLGDDSPAEVVALCERAYLSADALADPRAERLHDEARRLVARLVSARGLVFEPVQGTLLELSDGAPSKALLPVLEGQFRPRGYLPRPDRSPLRELWDRHAPFRVATLVAEAYGPEYFQSPNRTARIDVRLELRRAPSDSPLWLTRITGRTRVPAPRLNAFSSGYIGVSTRRDAEVERILYEDALAHLLERVPHHLANLPVCPPPGSQARPGDGP